MPAAMPNGHAGINGMPAPLNIPMNQINTQGSAGMNTMGHSVTSEMNSGNNGMDMGAITKVWQMASQSMNQNAPSNGYKITY
jgi:hypothetical protein